MTVDSKRYDLTPLQGNYITMADGLAARMRNDAQAARDRAHGLRKQADEADRVAANMASQAGKAVAAAIQVVASDLGAERPVETSMLFPGPKGIPSALELEWPTTPEPDPAAVSVAPLEVVDATAERETEPAKGTEDQPS